MNEKNHQLGLDITSGSSLVSLYDYQEGKVWINLKPSESATPTEVVLLPMLQRIALLGLETFMDISRTTEEPEAKKILAELRQFFTKTGERLSRRSGSQSFALSAYLLTEEPPFFGMSRETARRLWDNDADRIWDNV